MIVNVVFDNVKIYNVQNKLDVVKGVSFILEIEDPPQNMEVFSNNDLVLTIDHLSIKADNLGESKIRFMANLSIVKDLTINVVEQTAPIAVKLETKFGEAVPK